MAVVTRAGAHRLADPSTARGAGETSLYNPLRSNLDWQAAIADTAEQAGGMLTEKIEGVVEFIKGATGIDLSGPAALLGIVSSAIGLGPLEQILPKFLGGFDLDVEGNPIMAWIAENVPLAAAFAEAITGLAGGDLGAITRFFESVRAFFPFDLNDDAFDPAGAALDFIGQVLKPGGVLDGTSPLPAWNLFGDLAPKLFRLVPLTSIGDTDENLLDDGEYQNAAAFDGIEGIDHDPTIGRRTLGSAKVTAAGALREHLSDPAIPVTEGQRLAVEVYARHANLVGSGPTIALGVSAYSDRDGTILTGASVLQSVVAAGNSAGGINLFGIKLSGTSTIPAGVASVRVRPIVLPAAQTGVVWFDDAKVSKTQRLAQAFTDGLPEDLGDLFGSAAAATADLVDLAQSLAGSAVQTVQQGLASIAQRLANLNPLDGLFNAAGITNVEAIPAIPAANVGGIGGATSIGAALQTTWNQLRGGLARAFGGDWSIADVANAASATSEQADTAVQVGEWNNAILGIRNAEGLDSGIDPTGVSNFAVPKAGTGGAPPSVAATSAVTPIAFWVAPNDALRGSIQWWGQGNENLTAFYVDVYRMNYATSQKQLLFTSVDVLPQLGTTAQGFRPIRVNVQNANRIQTAHGDVLAIAFRAQGTGQHLIAAEPNAWQQADTIRHPRRPSARRAGTVGTIAFGAIDYGPLDTPVVALGIVEGDVAPPYYAPRTTEITTTGQWVDYVVPSWAKIVEGVYSPGGGGGHGGNGGDTRAGQGGKVGQWLGETLVRGVDFPDQPNVVLRVFVGAGGPKGVRESNGGNGGATTRQAITGGKAQVSTAGGLGATSYVGGDNNSAGEDMPAFTYGGVVYQGGQGGQGGRPGSPGAAPGAGGGGGFGGIYTVAYDGAAGGRGVAFFRATQS